MDRDDSERAQRMVEEQIMRALANRKVHTCTIYIVCNIVCTCRMALCVQVHVYTIIMNWHGLSHISTLCYLR